MTKQNQCKCTFIFAGWRDFKGFIMEGDPRLVGYNPDSYFRTPDPDSFSSYDEAGKWYQDNFLGSDDYGIEPYFKLVDV